MSGCQFHVLTKPVFNGKSNKRLGKRQQMRDTYRDDRWKARLAKHLSVQRVFPRRGAPEAGNGIRKV